MRAFRTAFVVCLAAAVLGCGFGKKTSVTGTITYKGQPVKGGTVYLMYEQGGSYQAGLKPDGSYEFMDVPTGNVKVSVKNDWLDPDQKVLNYGQKMGQLEKGYGKGMAEYNARMGRGEKKDAPAGEAPGLSKEQKDALAKVYVKIPTKYASTETTPLTYTVERGPQVKNFDLTD